MKKQRSAAGGKANEELSASPIKKQGSAAGGKANYRIKNRITEETRFGDRPKANYRIKNRITEETRFGDRPKGHCKDFRIIVPVKVQPPWHQRCSTLAPKVQHSYTDSGA